MKNEILLKDKKKEFIKILNHILPYSIENLDKLSFQTYISGERVHARINIDLELKNELSIFNSIQANIIKINKSNSYEVYLTYIKDSEDTSDVSLAEFSEKSYFNRNTIINFNKIMNNKKDLIDYAKIDTSNNKNMLEIFYCFKKIEDCYFNLTKTYFSFVMLEYLNDIGRITDNDLNEMFLIFSDYLKNAHYDQENIEQSKESYIDFLKRIPFYNCFNERGDFIKEELSSFLLLNHSI